MTALWARIEPLLGLVQKPARYIGCEDGAITPRHAPGKVSWLLAYPDTYEVGLPNQGLQILYEILNERGDAVAERTYAPWRDLDELLVRHHVPLFSVDTHRPAGDFDLLAFNLSSELVFTNVLQMIHLAGVPVRAEDRRPEHPLVVVGGHSAFNPEPLADFVDLVVLGEGEEVVGEITEVVGGWIRGGRADREAVLRDLAQVPGVYVPSLYEVTYDGPHIAAVTPRYPEVPATVDKRTIADLGAWPYPKRPLVPLTEVVHDRLSVEVFRGCTRGCRFCQAGMITRPVRERPADQVRTMVADGLRRTGYDEVSLTSLSTADFSDVEHVVGGILADREAAMPGCSTTVNLPSLRVDAFTVGLAAQVTAGRRSGLTFAPEAGSWRLRAVINKLITEDDLYGAVDAAFEQGWSRVKLYFLTGLPTETDEDTLGIAELTRACVALGQRRAGRSSVTASVGGFVPKPHTPFQWFGQNTRAELQRKIDLLRTATHKARNVHLKWHDPAATVAEGIASRGDRRIGRVIERVWRAGGTFQEWGEHFRLERWVEALEAEGLSLDWYVHRHRSRDEILPWSHLTAGLHEDFLWDDWQAALAGSGVEDCRWTPCYDCGVCTGYGIEHVVSSPVPPAGGSQGTGQDLDRGGQRAAVLAGLATVPVTLGDAPARGVATMKLRVRYAKVGKLRFTSHRDTARMWERAMRKAGLPVALSAGFTPRPRLSFGLALPTGAESTAEYLDVELARPLEREEVATLAARLTAALPDGVTVQAVIEREAGASSLQDAVTSVTWELAAPAGADVGAVAARLLAAAELPLERVRKGKRARDNVRPQILDLVPAGTTTLRAELSTSGRGLRPAELAALAFPDAEPSAVRALRTHQWIEHDGTRREVMTLGDIVPATSFGPVAAPAGAAGA